MEDQEKTSEKYYTVFERYVDSMYKIDGYYTIRYDTLIGKWFRYEDGYYHQITIQSIYQIFIEAMLVNGLAESTTKMNYCIKKLEALTQFDGHWDDNSPAIDNVLNGIVNLETRELEDHHPSYMFKYQVRRKYNPAVDRVIPTLYNEVLQCIPNPKQREYFNNFFLHVIHKNFDDEVFLMLYGVKGAGKSTLIQIFTEMYGPQMTSKTGLQKLGGRFGKTDMYDKRINAEPDLPIVDLNPYVISELKKLTGEDGYLEVELKNKDPFKYLISCFLVFGINQLMGFNQDAEKEIDSIMRRVILVECPTMMPKNAEFKKKIRDPEFLDELYSWGVITPPLLMYEPEEEEEWIRQNKELWLLNSDPILRICREEFEYCPPEIIQEESGIEIPLIQSIRIMEVITTVSECLEEEGQIIPKHTDIQTLITRSLKTMKILKNTRHGKNAAYENIVRRAEP